MMSKPSEMYGQVAAWVVSDEMSFREPLRLGLTTRNKVGEAQEV